ncbi:MAG: heavy-metal-associated domain-containing protein [Planctomycetes bacterium]|nr:heavy-metal-associated domain-containing protein [Planctomycetota bacterium]
MDNNTTFAGSISLVIGGMSCEHCVGAVSRALSAIPGVRVQAVMVGSATIEAAETAREEAARLAVEAVEEAGFSAEIARFTPNR